MPKIADFGLAKRVDDDSSQTQSGAILGTPSYMAPEQAGGKNREIGPAADIYSLGAILYELLVGRPPFKAGNPIDTIRQVIEQEPVPPRQLEPRVPHDLETICLKCLEKDPARRFATAADLADDLRRFVDGDPILARPTPAWERAWKWGKRRPAIVALLGVSTLAVVGMVLFIVWHNVSLRGQLDVASGGRTPGPAAGARRGRGAAAVAGPSRRGRSCSTVPGSPWPPAIGRVRGSNLEKALTTIGSEARARRLEGARPGAAETGRARTARRGRPAGVSGPVSEIRQAYATKPSSSARCTRAWIWPLTWRPRAPRSSKRWPSTASWRRRLGPRLDAYLNDSQKAEVLGDCYQLLLILAETEAQSASAQKPPEKEQYLRKALSFLEQARRLRHAFPGVSPAAGALPEHARRSGGGDAGREGGRKALPSTTFSITS